MAREGRGQAVAHARHRPFRAFAVRQVLEHRLELRRGVARPEQRGDRPDARGVAAEGLEVVAERP